MPKKPVKSKPKKEEEATRADHVEFSEEIVTAICELMSEGTSLRSICAQEGMPVKSTVFRWLDDNEKFRDQYARAKEHRAEFHVEEILEIVDNKALDPADKRVKMDARKWFASKMDSKRYGDKIQNEHSGPGGGPIKTEQQTVFFNPVGGDDS